MTRICLVITSLLFLTGCDSLSPEARRQQSLEMLAQLKRNVDVNGADTPDTVVGDLAPATTGTTSEGYDFDINDHRGELVLISFFGGG